MSHHIQPWETDHESIEEKTPQDMAELVSMVFSQPPTPPQSNVAQLENIESSHELFQFLGEFFTRGVEYLFGEHTSVANLTQKDIELIQQYVCSFGWEFVINPTDPSEHPRALPWVLSIPYDRNHPAQRIRLIFQMLK